jgi:hypothetical protein
VTLLATTAFWAPLAPWVAVVVLAQDTPGTPVSVNDLWRLGPPVVAMLLGMYVVYRFFLLPERQRSERAEARADRAEAEKVEAYKVTLPALAQAAAGLDRTVEALKELEGTASSPRSRRASP